MKDVDIDRFQQTMPHTERKIPAAQLLFQIGCQNHHHGFMMSVLPEHCKNLFSVHIAGVKVKNQNIEFSVFQDFHAFRGGYGELKMRLRIGKDHGNQPAVQVILINDQHSGFGNACACRGGHGWDSGTMPVRISVSAF